MTDTVRIQKPQALAELSYDTSGVIEASAGTGKTYTIEHMVVDLILEEDVPISKILVVTFTEKATSELVARVRTILRDILRADSDDLDDPDDPHWVINKDARDSLWKALLSFDRAPVYTIHGFCNRILSQHAFPNRRPFEQDQIDSNELFERVFPEVLRTVLARDDDYKQALQGYISNNNLDNLKSLIQDSTGTWEEIRPTVDEEELNVLKDKLEFLDENFDRLRSRIESAIKNNEVGGRAKSKIKRILQALTRAVEAYRNQESLWIFKQTVAKNVSYNDDPYEYFVVKKGDEPWMPEEIPEALEPFMESQVSIEAVIANRFSEKVAERLEREKNEEGVYTYDDMLEMVKEGLTGSGKQELIQTLRSEFDYAIIDEFQDTDPRQWKIFKTLFYDSGSSNPCYLIGDPKQAIYGFRGADVKTYRNATDTLVRENEGENWVTLDTNFRSTPELIQAYNRILGPDESGSFFDEEGNNAYEDPVTPGFGDKWFGTEEGENNVPSVVIPSLSHSHDEGVKARSYERMLGHYYADEIKELLNGDYHVSNDDGGNPRELTGNDIFVLVNKSKEADLMGQYLQAENIPYSFYKEEGLFQSDEARYLFEVLQASLAPGDRSRRLMAWNTPFFDVKLDELAEIDRITDEDHPLFKRLVRWNEFAEAGRVGQLLHSVLHDSGILRRSIYRYPGERALSNYQQLGDRLNQWWQEDSLSAEELTARLGRFVREDQKPGEEEEDTKHIESDRSSVQIMTMHKAKGLEAPVVFLYGGWGRGRYTSYSFYPEDSDTRVKYFGNKSGPYHEQIDQYQREEAERLLYVAMTRAAGRLYLPYVKRENRGSSPGGRISVMFDRLEDFIEPDQEDNPLEDDPRFEITEPDTPDSLPALTDPARPPNTTYDLPKGIEDWSDVSFDDYRANNQLFIESYSSVSRIRKAENEPDDEQLLLGEKEPLVLVDDTADEPLPAGRTFGLLVHELLENFDYERVENYRRDGGFENWSADPDVESLFDTTMEKYDFDPGHRQGILRLVWQSLTGVVPVGDESLEALSSVPRHESEMEFWFPIPEEDHPVPSDGRDEGPATAQLPFEADRGYIRGFIDFVFEWNGRIYFADWKTDSFETRYDYQPEQLGEHVREHYQAQLTFYTHALMRMVKRSGGSLEENFGGLFYFFVRGMSLERRDPETGIYFYHPEPGNFDTVFEETRNLVSESIKKRRDVIRGD